jgi:hypothetical protein
MARADSDSPPAEEFSGHLPVLLNEVIEGLSLYPGALIIDGTLAQGARGIRRHRPMGANWHLTATLLRGESAGPPEQLRGPTGRRNASARRWGVPGARLRDGGMHPVDPATRRSRSMTWRGFSFRTPGPLDMRYDTRYRRQSSQRPNGTMDLSYRWGSAIRGASRARSSRRGPFTRRRN